jgi:nucleoside-diphosphate-sugar epimerase
MSQLQARGADARGFSSRELNLRDPSAFGVLDPVVGPETTLYVCSALTPDRGASIDTCADHIGMTANLARYLSDKNIGKCIFVSSDAVYPFDFEKVDETTPVAPTGAYAVAKYTSECLMQMAFAQHPQQLLIVRPAAVFGPGDTHNSYGPNRFVRTALGDHSVRLFGQGEETRDHLYVEDLSRVLVDLSATEDSGTVNIATGTSRSFGSIVDLLGTLAPEPFEVVHAPRGGAITHRQFDTSRLQRVLPELQFTPFEDALRTTVEAAAASVAA